MRYSRKSKRRDPVKRHRQEEFKAHLLAVAELLRHGGTAPWRR